MQIKVHDQTHELTTLSDDELLALKLEVDTVIDKIGSQLERARLTAKTERVFADPKWYQSATTAKKIHARSSQAIQQELSRRRKKRREAAESVPEAFMQVARRRLADEVFVEMLDEARSMVEAV